MLDPKQRQRFLRDNRARIGIGIVVVMEHQENDTFTD